MKFVFPASNVLQRLTLRLFADYAVEGVEHVPPAGPLIVVANHQSNMDPPLLGASLRRRINFLAKDNMFRGPLVTWFLRSYGAFPLNREGADIKAYRWALKKLEEGRALVIFPEGTRNPGGMRKGLPGVVQLAIRSNAPLLPVGITGTEGIGHWIRVINPTGRIRVNIGTVFYLPSIEGKPSKQVMESLSEMIMYRIATLLPETYHGVYRTRQESSAAASDVT